MKKTIKTAALVATTAAITATSIPFNVFAATPTVTSKYTADQQAAIKTIFNATEYAEMNPDVAAAFGTDENKLFEHYLVFGIDENRAPSKTFDVNTYASSYPDLQVAFGDNVDSYILHYATFGQKENRTLTTVEAANQSGYSVYSVATFKTGVKGVTGVSLISGGVVKLTDRQPQSSDSSSQKKTDFFYINGRKARLTEGQTFGALFNQYADELEYEVVSGSFLKYNGHFMYNPDTKDLVKTSDLIKSETDYKFCSVFYLDGKPCYLADEDMTWGQYAETYKNGEWTSYGEYIKIKDTNKYLTAGSINDLVDYELPIEADREYEWKQGTLFKIHNENGIDEKYIFSTEDDWKTIFPESSGVTIDNNKFYKKVDGKIYCLYNGEDEITYNDNDPTKPSDGVTYTWKQVIIN